MRGRLIALLALLALVAAPGSGTGIGPAAYAHDSDIDNAAASYERFTLFVEAIAMHGDGPIKTGDVLISVSPQKDGGRDAYKSLVACSRDGAALEGVLAESITRTYGNLVRGIDFETRSRCEETKGAA